MVLDCMLTNIAFVHILNHPRGDCNQSVMFMMPNAEGWPWVLRRIVVLHSKAEARRSGGGCPRQETHEL